MTRDTNQNTYETKALDGTPPTSLEVVEAFDGFMQAFEAFKETNDERLSEIEARITADPVTEEKLARIDAVLDRQKSALDQLVLKHRRPVLAVDNVSHNGANRERKAAFEAYVRRGDASAYARMATKAFSAGSGPDGGYLVPDETETEIGRRLANISPIRAISSVRQVSTGTYNKPFSTDGLASGWVGETAARPQTNTVTLAELAFPAMELYAMPAATQTLLDDTAVDMDRWIAEEVEQAFATQEGAAFVSGDGIAKPKGFLNYTTVAEDTWEWGTIGFVPTGVSADFAATDPANAFIDLIYALKGGYRQNARFVMNRRTQAAIRKLKDADDTYLWQPPAQAGGQASLMGFPVVEAEDMPDIGAGSLSVAFGDFQRGYLVVDRLGVRILRDPYSAKPYVLFYTTKRVGGGVQDFDAIKLMKFAAS